MNAKLKIAILALLGFSTACCAQKKAAKKSQDNEPAKIEADTIDTRIMLMYGVPGPNGELPQPMTEEEALKKFEEAKAQAKATEENTEAQSAE